MTGPGANLLVGMAAGVISLFCAGFAAAQIVSPQVLLGGLLP